MDWDRVVFGFESGEISNKLEATLKLGSHDSLFVPEHTAWGDVHKDKFFGYKPLLHTPGTSFLYTLLLHQQVYFIVGEVEYVWVGREKYLLLCIKGTMQSCV